MATAMFNRKDPAMKTNVGGIDKALRVVDADDLVGEHPVLPRRGRFLMRACGELVLLGAAALGGGYFWLDGVFKGDGPATEDGKPRFVVVEKKEAQ